MIEFKVFFTKGYNDFFQGALPLKEGGVCAVEGEVYSNYCFISRVGIYVRGTLMD